MVDAERLLGQLEGGEITLGPVAEGGLEILFTGDLHPGGRTEGMLLRGEHDATFGDALPLLRGADLAVTNLEAPLTRRGSPIPKTGPSFRADPGCAAGLRAAGFDVASLANNHVLDYGAIGLEDTVAACHRAGLETVGAGGEAAAARAPLILERRSRRVAFLSFAEGEFSTSTGGAGANPLDPVANYHQVLEARKQADLLFVSIHGGHEFHPLPSPRMVETYRFFAELGVTAVIAHHPHVPGGMEVHAGVPIFYSLGTLLFDPPRREPDEFHEGFLARFRTSGAGLASASILPYWQYRGDPGVRLMTGAARQGFLARLRARSAIIQDEGALAAAWAEFCARKKGAYLSALHQRGGLRGLLTGRAAGESGRLRLLLNLFRCQAHQEACIEILERAVEEDRPAR